MEVSAQSSIATSARDSVPVRAAFRLARNFSGRLISLYFMSNAPFKSDFRKRVSDKLSSLSLPTHLSRTTLIVITKVRSKRVFCKKSKESVSCMLISCA